MTSRKKSWSPPTAVAVAVSPMVIPASRPRNRLAADPLLRKSGPHADQSNKRLRVKTLESTQDIVDVLNRHSNTED